MSQNKVRIVFALVLIAIVFTGSCDAKRKRSKKVAAAAAVAATTEAATGTATAQPPAFTPGVVEGKQDELRETNPPNFVRLLVMRLIYGIATQMGLEERISGVFNGAFAPPNADYDDFDLGDLGAAGDELF